MDKNQILADLWMKVAEVLKEELSAKERSPHWAQAAIRFLKDNEVEALPTKGSSLDEIRELLPFPIGEEFVP